MFGIKGKQDNRKKDEEVTFVIVAGCAGSGKTSLGEQISKKICWTYVDKDTVTRDFTDFILVDKGKSKNDRESEFYCNKIRPIEYKITFKICEENLRLGNSVVLTIPLIAQIQDYCKWEQMIDEYGIDLNDIKVKFVWINHDIGSEYTRVKKRNADRDGYKLNHWEEYGKQVEDIIPDKKYNAYCYNNDSATADAIYVEDVIEWIIK